MPSVIVLRLAKDMCERWVIDTLRGLAPGRFGLGRAATISVVLAALSLFFYEIFFVYVRPNELGMSGYRSIRSPGRQEIGIYEDRHAGFYKSFESAQGFH